MATFVEDPDWHAKMSRHALDYLGGIADDIRDDAKLHTPVDTGALRASMKAVVSQNGVARIGSDLKYSLYVEEGHRVVHVDQDGHKKWTGKTVQGHYMLQRALYKKRG